VDDDYDFEASVFDAFVASADDEEFDRRLAEIGTALAQAREGYLHDRDGLDALVDGAEAGR
ncbi:MAG: hypothetical protein ACM3JP_03275, partial [Betaproteobacteria bacterium]